MHPHHHSAEGHGWRSYLKEFFMLFLAVLCGYFSELAFEHHIEGRREKTYLVSLLEDLEKDTSMLRSTKIRAMDLSAGLDTLRHLLFRYSELAPADALLYQLNFDNTRWILPEFNDKTITQLRYSGNFRLIRDQELANLISDYWIKAEIIMKNAEEYIRDVEIAEGQMNAIFNRKYVSIDTASHFGHKKFVIAPDCQLLSRDTMILTRYANLLHLMGDVATYYIIPFIREQQGMANELIFMIRKELDIDD